MDTVMWFMLCGKRPGMLQMAILYHDNAPSLRARQTTSNKKTQLWTFIPPPYSPDLAPCDIFLFTLIKSVLIVTRFEDVADLSNVVQRAIDEITINLYRSCFLTWVKHCRKCVNYKGYLFEREWHCAPMCLRTTMERTFHTGALGRAIWRCHDVV